MIDTSTRMCSHCIHYAVCTYREDTEKISDDMTWISKDIPTNIKIEMRCTFFKEKSSGTYKWEDGSEKGLASRTWDFMPAYVDHITTNHTEVSKK